MMDYLDSKCLGSGDDHEIEKVVEVRPENLIDLDWVYYNTEGSEISKFFAGRYVFLSGGTGFLGKLLVEKLLRACPDIGGIFMLVRAKKGKDVHTRIDEIFNDVLYGKLSRLQPKFRHKITPINGDASLPGLGISLEDRNLLTEKVSAIYHVAATVKFDEKLNTAVAINVRGTKDMLALASDCKQLKTFVHVSTAFANCHIKRIDERCYDLPIDTDRIIQVCESTPQQTLEKITPDLIAPWPNTYTFTKAVAEDTVLRYGSKLPVCIFRPAVVVATYREPVRSWIDNIYGPTGIVIGAGTGILRALNCDKTKIAEIVPGDMVVNAMIAASYKTALTADRPKEVPVYNYVSSPQKPITWEEFCDLNKKHGLSTPTVRCLWYYSFTLVKNRYAYYLYVLFLHLLPALLVDAVAVLTWRKPELLKIYKKVHKFSNVLTYFNTQSWLYSNDNVRALWDGLGDEDRKLFFFDMSKLDWDEFFQSHVMGLRTYVIKDDPSTLPEARAKWRRLHILHRTMQAVAVFVCLRILYGILATLLL